MRRPALSLTTSHIALLLLLLSLSLFVAALLLPVIFAVGHDMSDHTCSENSGDHQASRITPLVVTVCDPTAKASLPQPLVVRDLFSLPADLWKPPACGP